MEKTKLSKNSSLLVSVPALLLWGLLCLASAAVGYLALAGLFLFFLLLFSFVRYWAERAMDKLSLEVRCGRRGLFPGMETELTYTLKNDKLLPLVWLELSQRAPEKECMIPDESFESYSYLHDDGDKVQEIQAFKRGFSLVMGYESIRLSSVWKASRRGIYRPDELLLRSGDGFGLSQVEKYYPAELLPEIVVYPKKVEVDSSIFYRQDWDKSFGALGYVEDMTVLRGMRPYSTTDSWKRINWRAAARQPGQLNVNLYETVQPATALFVLDGESYCRDEAALEEALEILGSVLSRLTASGMGCGLCLPESARFPALCISPQTQPDASELLYYLAGFDCLKARIMDKEKQWTGEYSPSAFELAALENAAADCGSVTLITHDASRLSAQMLGRLDKSRLLLFSSGDMNCQDKELAVRPLNWLKKGEKQ